MATTPKNTVRVKVIKVKDKPFYATIGPGGTVLAANPMFDPVSGSKDMTNKEVYAEYEKLIMLDEHIRNPNHYQELSYHYAPDNMEMFAALDMRKRTVSESVDALVQSTKV